MTKSAAMYSHSEPDEFLYHYTSCRNVLQILESGRLRLDPVSQLNDPRESKPWRTIPRCGGFGERIHPEDLVDEVDRLLRHRSKLACLALDGPKQPVHPQAFGRGFTRARMWSQYARGDTGACLVFRRDRLLESAQAAAGLKGIPLYHGPVNYFDDSIRGLERLNVDTTMTAEEVEHTVETFIAEHWSDLFFTKSVDWSSEYEYRLLMRSPEDVESNVSLDRSVAGVVLGEDFPEQMTDPVLHHARRLGSTCPARRCSWHNGLLLAHPAHRAPPPVFRLPAIGAEKPS